MEPIIAEPKQVTTNCNSPTSKSAQPELELDDQKKNAQMTRSPSARSTCLCSPTTHVGSFRCRLHRGTAISRGGSEGSNLSDLAQKSAAVEDSMEVCWLLVAIGGCFESDMAGFDAAISDGVDVLSMEVL
ncbi:hypothetical protein SDJN03_25117, partial [Cucurbita argyrosperma subsp. sororia]